MERGVNTSSLSAQRELQVLLESLLLKLDSSKPLLARSLTFGRLTWRRRKTGEYEITLDLRV